MAGTARKLASGLLFRFANVIATAIVSVMVMPFVVHTLGDRNYGIWTLVATFVGYYGVLELGLAPAVTRYLSRSLGAGDRETCNRVYNTSLRLYLGIGLIAMAVSGTLAALAPWLCHNPADVALFWKLILILGVSVALLFPTRVFKGLLEAHLRFDLTGSFDLLSLVLRTGLIFPVLLAGYGILGLAWLSLLSSLPSMALLIYFSYRELSFLRIEGRYWQRDTARSLFSYSIYSLITNLANILRFKLDSVVVAGYVGLSAVTHYRIGGTLTQYFFDLMSSAFGIFPSIFSRQEGAKDFAILRKTFFFASKLAVCVSSFIGFALLAWGKPFIIRWMGRQYVDSYRVMVILVIGVMVSLWQGPSISLLYGISKHKVYAILNSIEGIANLLLSLLLVHWYGMYGVALGTLFPMLVSRLFVQPVYVCRVAGIDLWEYVRKTGRTLASVAAALVVPLLISIKFAAPNYKVLFMLGILSALLYAGTLWIVEFSQGETQILRRAIWPNLPLKKVPEVASD
jgi:O-antigen/teichoic acid export membrane protein